MVSAITRRPSLTAHHKQRAACDGDESHGLARRCHTMSYPRASASCTVRCNWILQENGANRCVRTYSGSALQSFRLVLRYVRTQRITGKHRHIRMHQRLDPEKSPHPATGGVGHIVADSRLYLPWLAITASLKLRGFSAVKPFSAQKIWYTSYSSLELMVASAFSRI